MNRGRARPRLATRRAPAPRRDVVVRSTRLHAGRVILGVPALDRIRIPAVDQQPLVLAPAIPAGPDEDERAAQLLAVELELQLAVAQRTRRIVDGGVGR